MTRLEWTLKSYSMSHVDQFLLTKEDLEGAPFELWHFYVKFGTLQVEQDSFCFAVAYFEGRQNRI